MNLATYKKFKGDRLMPWGKATVVTGAKGYVFLAGNTATAEDYDPLNQRGGAIGDPAMQWRAILANIKSDLEELGSSLEHLVKLTYCVKGPFPKGPARQEIKRAWISVGGQPQNPNAHHLAALE